MPSSTPSTNPEKILIVEDDPAIRNLLHRFLSRQQNYQVESAADGTSAMTIFGQFDPDLVILDLDLPDTNGCDLCREMQEQTGVFVLALTS